MYATKIVLPIILIELILLGSVYYVENIYGPAEEFPREKVFHYTQQYAGEVLDNFNPFLPIGGGYQSGQTGFYSVCFEPLLIGNTATGNIDPWLAERWEYGPNYSSIKLFLRTGATWSDGVPFTAEDVVFTFNMLKDNAPKLLFSIWAETWIKECSAIDDHTVLIILNKPHPRFHIDLAMIAHPGPVPKHIWSKVENVTFFQNNPPICTGPYTLYRRTPTTTVWKRRDNYWGPMPEPEWIIWDVVGTFEKMMLMQINHETEIVTGYSKDQVREVLSRNPYIHKPTWIWADPCPMTVVFNFVKYPLNLAEVRWAICYAINKTKVSEYAFGGRGPILGTPWMELPSLMKYVPKSVLDEYYTKIYDMSKTIEILEGLGFTRGDDGVWVTPNGTRLSFNLLAVGEWPDSNAAAYCIADDLNAIGIETVVQPFGSSIFYDKWSRGDFDLCIGWPDIYGGLDPAELFMNYLSKDVKPIGETATMNEERYSNPEYDDYYEQAMKVTPEEAAPMYAKLIEIWLRDLINVPLCGWAFEVVWDEYYWSNWPSMENPYTNPECWTPWFYNTITRLKSTGRLPPRSAPVGTYAMIVAIAATIGTWLLISKIRKS